MNPKAVIFVLNEDRRSDLRDNIIGLGSLPQLERILAVMSGEVLEVLPLLRFPHFAPHVAFASTGQRQPTKFSTKIPVWLPGNPCPNQILGLPES
ncbi:hypothetical protein SLE2022_215750 [Rubroshorea leprosula]